MPESKTQCLIVGGGPAGMMVGYLLARAGIAVTVLEKHGDFLRDFRGDTIHPSTLDVMHEVGLLDSLLSRPHQKLTDIGAHIGEARLKVADFSHLPTHCPFMLFMPQWDFLDTLAQAAGAFPHFTLRMNTTATDLIQDNGHVVGVRAQDTEGALSLYADLVIGADGRTSCVRESARLPITDLGAPIDVLWLRLPRHEQDPAETLGRVDKGKVLIMIDRRDYWQCAFIIPKGGLREVKQKGLPAFRQQLGELQPALADRVEALQSWDDIKLLTVRLDRLDTWAKEGLLCIGDAAHAMSPVGGVGINLAIQDAVATANLITGALRAGRVPIATLHKVQQRRRLPTRLTQAAQVFVHKRILLPVLNNGQPVSPPIPLRLLNRFPLLRRLPGRAIGMGVRPEHVK